MYTLFVLYKTFLDFINSIMREIVMTILVIFGTNLKISYNISYNIQGGW